MSMGAWFLWKGINTFQIHIIIKLNNISWANRKYQFDPKIFWNAEILVGVKMFLVYTCGSEK